MNGLDEMMTQEMQETVERTEIVAAEPTESLAAMLGIEMPHGLGDRVPPLWHWTYLLERSAQDVLGEDGHPLVGIPAPPAPDRRRMFAGGRVTTHSLLEIGKAATKVTSIANSVDKEGRSGSLTFVTVLQEIFQNGQLVISEEQDIVYRESGTGSLPVAAASEPPAEGPTLELDVDERTLFRFSALTYNTHRIHFDVEWCRKEGYDGLVIHGPLLAFMMGEHMRREGIDLVGKTFGYRFVSPMTGTQKFSVVPATDGLASGAQARSAAGTVCAISTLKEV